MAFFFCKRHWRHSLYRTIIGSRFFFIVVDFFFTHTGARSQRNLSQTAVAPVIRADIPAQRRNCIHQSATLSLHTLRQFPGKQQGTPESHTCTHVVAIILFTGICSLLPCLVGRYKCENGASVPSRPSAAMMWLHVFRYSNSAFRSGIT